MTKLISHSSRLTRGFSVCLLMILAGCGGAGQPNNLQVINQGNADLIKDACIQASALQIVSSETEFDDRATCYSAGHLVISGPINGNRTNTVGSASFTVAGGSVVTADISKLISGHGRMTITNNASDPSKWDIRLNSRNYRGLSLISYGFVPSDDPSGIGSMIGSGTPIEYREDHSLIITGYDPVAGIADRVVSFVEDPNLLDSVGEANVRFVWLSASVSVLDLGKTAGAISPLPALTFLTDGANHDDNSFVDKFTLEDLAVELKFSASAVNNYNARLRVGGVLVAQSRLSAGQTGAPGELVTTISGAWEHLRFHVDRPQAGSGLYNRFVVRSNIQDPSATSLLEVQLSGEETVGAIGDLQLDVSETDSYERLRVAVVTQSGTVASAQPGDSFDIANAWRFRIRYISGTDDYVYNWQLPTALAAEPTEDPPDPGSSISGLTLLYREDLFPVDTSDVYIASYAPGSSPLGGDPPVVESLSSKLANPAIAGLTDTPSDCVTDPTSGDRYMAYGVINPAVTGGFPAETWRLNMSDSTTSLYDSGLLPRALDLGVDSSGGVNIAGRLIEFGVGIDFYLGDFLSGSYSKIVLPSGQFDDGDAIHTDGDRLSLQTFESTSPHTTYRMLEYNPQTLSTPFEAVSFTETNPDPNFIQIMENSAGYNGYYVYMRDGAEFGTVTNQDIYLKYPTGAPFRFIDLTASTRDYGFVHRFNIMPATSVSPTASPTDPPWLSVVFLSRDSPSSSTVVRDARFIELSPSIEGLSLSIDSVIASPSLAVPANIGANPTTGGDLKSIRGGCTFAISF